MDVVVIMLRATDILSRKERNDSLQGMANEPYFISAYRNMDKRHLKLYHYVLAWCMYRKYCTAVIILEKARLIASVIKKTISRR